MRQGKDGPMTTVNRHVTKRLGTPEKMALGLERFVNQMKTGDELCPVTCAVEHEHVAAFYFEVTVPIGDEEVLLAEGLYGGTSMEQVAGLVEGATEGMAMMQGEHLLACAQAAGR